MRVLRVGRALGSRRKGLTGVWTAVGDSGGLLRPAGRVRALLGSGLGLVLTEDLGEVLGDAVHVRRLTVGPGKCFVLNGAGQLGGVATRDLLVGLDGRGEFPQHRAADFVGVGGALPSIKILISDSIVVFKVGVVLRALVLVWCGVVRWWWCWGVQRIEVIKLRGVNLIKQSLGASSECGAPIREVVV